MSKVLSPIKSTTYRENTDSLLSLSYANDKFISPMKQTGSVIGYSFDGIAWNYSSRGTNGNLLLCKNTVYCNGVYIMAVGGYLKNGYRATDIYLYSTDGINWEQKQLPVMANWQAVATGGTEDGLFVLAGGHYILWSSDGLNWTQKEITTDDTQAKTGDFVDVVYIGKSAEGLGDYCFLMGDLQSRTNTISLLYGTPSGTSGSWIYVEISPELTTQFAQSVTIGNANLYITETQLIFYGRYDSFFCHASLNNFISSTSWDTTAVEVEEEPLTRVAAGYSDGELIINGHTASTATTARKNYLLSVSKNASSVKEIKVGNFPLSPVVVSIASGDSRICLGTNNSNALFYINKINPLQVIPERLMNYSDIQAGNYTDWMDFVSKMKSNDIAGAKTIAKQLTSVQMNATQLNELLEFIENVQYLDDTDFKLSKIWTTPTPPPILSVGQMYFKEYI